MSREIKFKVRASSLIQVGEGGASTVIAPGEWITYLPESFPIIWKDKIDLSTRRQYTGLKDKHGAEIYEGDIIKDIRGVWKVAWSVGGFVAAPIKANNRYGVEHRSKPLGFMSVVTEVIGNIYENPNLVEGGTS